MIMSENHNCQIALGSCRIQDKKVHEKYFCEKIHLRPQTRKTYKILSRWYNLNDLKRSINNMFIIISSMSKELFICEKLSHPGETSHQSEILAEWCISLCKNKSFIREQIHPTQVRSHLNADLISLLWPDFSPCKQILPGCPPRGSSYGGEVARLLGGLAYLGEISPSLRNFMQNIMCSFEK